ncbi:Ricin B-like lectin [Sesbania bispinosa]|nr:Ricin B-like lectin [Sesbania bispinosa]
MELRFDHVHGDSSNHQQQSESHHPVPHTVNHFYNEVVPKVAPNYALTIRDGNVILSPYDPTNEHQHWYKDERYSTLVKDELGHLLSLWLTKRQGKPLGIPVVLLNRKWNVKSNVNVKLSGHNSAHNTEVRLIPFRCDYFDESIMWTQGDDLGEGFKSMRMANNHHLNLDACQGGGVRDGTIVILHVWTIW